VKYFFFSHTFFSLSPFFPISFYPFPSSSTSVSRLFSLQVVAGPFEVLTVDFSSDAANAYDGGLEFVTKLPVLSEGEAHAVVSW
jgi:hypothetical protein